MNKILIYNQFKSNSLTYTIDFLSEWFESIEFEIIHSLDSLSDSENFFINYTENRVDRSIHLPNAGLLKDGFEMSDFDSFQTQLEFENSSFNFDFLSAIFYLISRAEEYQNPKFDKHGRYEPEESILWKKGLLEEPLIDKWIISFIDIVNREFGLQLKLKHKFEFQSTLDIDHMFAYQHKPLPIKLGSFVKDVLKMKFIKLKRRFSSKDPFDTYSEIFDFHDTLGFKLIVFILCSVRSKFDKSLSPDNKESIYRIQSISDRNDVGIHPSYKSNSNPIKIENEKKLLESIVSKSISSSRQHYLRIKFPLTYRSLIEAGINNDYSMGYPSKIGFRAGTSRPFLWYDLLKDEITTLRIYPFQIMDVTLKSYLKLTPDEALKSSIDLIKKIKEVSGYCSIIWHNSSFYELEGWKDWGETYRNILSFIKSN